MVAHMKVSFTKMTFMDKDRSTGLMAGITRANGAETKCMARVFSHGLMVKCTGVALKTIFSQARV